MVRGAHTGQRSVPWPFSTSSIDENLSCAGVEAVAEVGRATAAAEKAIPKRVRQGTQTAWGRRSRAACSETKRLQSPTCEFYDIALPAGRAARATTLSCAHLFALCVLYEPQRRLVCDALQLTHQGRASAASPRLQATLIWHRRRAWSTARRRASAPRFPPPWPLGQPLAPLAGASEQ
jgi:hypothetical protein